MKNSNDTFGNRTRDLPVCSTVSQKLRHRVTRKGWVDPRFCTGRIMTMKNSNENIGNRNRDLPICSTVPQKLRHRVTCKGWVDPLIYTGRSAKLSPIFGCL